MHIPFFSGQQRKYVILWTTIGLTALSCIPVAWWNALSARMGMSANGVLAVHVGSDAANIVAAARSAADRQTSASVPGVRDADEDSLPVNTDVPGPNGPPPLYLQDGQDKYRLVHTISKWNDMSHRWIPISPDLTQYGLPNSPGYGVDGITAAVKSHRTWVVGTLIGNVLVKGPNSPWAYRDNQLPERTVTAVALGAGSATSITVAIGFGGFGSTTPQAPGHIYVTHNGGQSWVDVTGNLPDLTVDQLVWSTVGAKEGLRAHIGGHWYAWVGGGQWVLNDGE